MPTEIPGDEIVMRGGTVMSPHRVLCVEDEAVVAWNLALNLEDLGYEVLGCFARGEEAVQKAEETNPHIILMDIKLEGELDGIQAARIIRARQNIPVIFLTAYGDEETLKRALSVPPATFLIKPVKQRELRAAIEVALRTHELERQLEESEAKYRELVENANSIIVRIDTEGCITFINEFGGKFFGYSEEEVLGRNMVGTLAADRATGGPELASMIQNILLNPEKYEKCVKEAVRRDGEHVWLSWTHKAVTDEKGHLVGILGIANDIRALRRTEQEPAAQREGFKALLKAETDPAVPLDADEKVLAVKKPPLRGLHLTQDEIAHKTAGDLLELSRQLFQAQKMEAVGTLAGVVAHDFNNILQVVLGYSELLLAEKGEHDPARADLQKMNQAAQKGADLVRRLLSFSRKAEFNPRPVDLNHQIEQLEKMLTRTIPRMIKIRLNLADGLSRVNADPTQMDQVLMNLAVNARDAMPEGGDLLIETANVFLHEDFARMHLGLKSGEYVLLSVSDTGHGMDEETSEHIFEPFYTTKERGKGTGLGLAMVYGIVTQHGGRIDCYSEPGHGTTFKIYLPALAEDRDQLEKTKSELVAGGGTETILLVDDEELVRDLGKRILERAGYSVLTVANGKEALHLYGREMEKISLVILDLIMPEMGGKQCLEELLRVDRNIRVLIASGFAANGQTKEAIETGARGFVGKPYNVKQMLKAVREVLDSE